MKKKNGHCIRCGLNLQKNHIRCLITHAGLICENCWNKPEKEKVRRCYIA